MAWNKQSDRKVERKGEGGQRNVLLRGLFAGTIVAILGVVAMIFFRSSSPTSDGGKATRPRRIHEVKPVAVARAETNATPRVKDPHEGYVLSSSGVWQPKGIPYKPEWKKVHHVHTNKAALARKSVPYANATEQILLQVFGCKPGMRPYPLQRIPKKDMDNLIGILSSPNPITEKDSPQSVRAKATINRAKKEFMKFIKGGGKPEDFLKSYHAQLEKAYAMRSEAMKMSHEMSEQGDEPEMTREFQNKVNEKFRREGLTTIPVDGVQPGGGIDLK